MKINISGDVRAFAAENGIEVGKRGRLSKDVKVAFLTAHSDVARTVASANGVEVPAKGRLSESSIEAIADSFA